MIYLYYGLADLVIGLVLGAGLAVYHERRRIRRQIHRGAHGEYVLTEHRPNPNQINVTLLPAKRVGPSQIQRSRWLPW